MSYSLLVSLKQGNIRDVLIMAKRDSSLARSFRIASVIPNDIDIGQAQGGIACMPQGRVLLSACMANCALQAWIYSYR